MLPQAPEPRPGKHLLYDLTGNGVIHDVYRLERSVHRPRRDPATPVLVPELGWEGQTCTPLHVIYDAPNHRWRMWYQAHDMRVEEERKALKKSLYGNLGEPQPIYMCYAESSDGVRWERPRLDVFKHKTGEATNIVFKGHSYAAGNTLIHQPEAPADRRWILVNNDWASDQTGGIYVAASPDGIHWKYINEKPYIHGESDTWNNLVWNEEAKCYMLYMRAWHSAGWGWKADTVAGPNTVGPWKDNPRRRVAFSQSPDLSEGSFTEPRIIIMPDELDPDDFYGFQVFRYGSDYVGFLWVYEDPPSETIWIEPAFSPDGVNWQRLPKREPFIDVGQRDEPDGGMIIPAQEPVRVGDDLFIYYTGHQMPHSSGSSTTQAFRTKLRLDGFVSLHASRLPAALITRPFTLQSDRIEINAACYAGQIKAELVEPWWYDPSGQSIEGFGAADFDVFSGDSVRHTLSWRGRSDLSALRGKRVMLRMSLYHADLYSITI